MMQFASILQTLATMRSAGPKRSVHREPLPTMPNGRMPFRRMTATRCATPPEIQMPPEPSRGSNRGLTSILTKFWLVRRVCQWHGLD